MSATTAIAWTDKSWNPLVGCTKVSPGCAHCYAEQLHAMRHKAFSAGKLQNLRQYAKPFEVVQMMPDRLWEPLGWRKPVKIFVNSVSDVFHDDVPFDFIDQMFAVMALTPWHTYQVLTKRPKRMREYFSELFQKRTDIDAGPTDRHGKVLEAVEDMVYQGRGLTYFSHDRWWTEDGGSIAFAQPWPLPNVWLGTSVENDRWVERAYTLCKIPAAVRFLSCEPLLGPIDLSTPDPSLDHRSPIEMLDWIIVGGESGPKHRPMELAWARELREQCHLEGVAFFLKQLGGHPDSRTKTRAMLDGATYTEFPA